MGDLVQKDAELYQTRHGAVFHVEPMPFRKVIEGRIRRIKRRHEQLRGQAYHLFQKAFQVACVELSRWIIHK